MWSDNDLGFFTVCYQCFVTLSKMSECKDALGPLGTRAIIE